MAENESWVRVRHALRVAIGGALIHSIAIRLPITPGCLSPVFFYISTIAGTSENLLGFQLISATSVFWGAIIALLCFSLIILIGGTSKIAVFFVTLPFLPLFAAFRTDRAVLPLPIITSMFTGLLVISRFGVTRADLFGVVIRLLVDISLAYFVAIFVNLLIKPDRASDRGRKIVADQLKYLGAALSFAGSHVFAENPKPYVSQPPYIPYRRRSNSGFEGTPEDIAMAAELLAKDSALRQDSSESEGEFPSYAYLRYTDTNRTAKFFSNILQQVRPMGRAQQANFESLSRAGVFFEASKSEPSTSLKTVLRWRNHEAWGRLLKSLGGLTTKVVSLTSAAMTPDDSGTRFSKGEIMHLFGEAYFPLWKAHFASCAAACSAMSCHLRNDKCSDMFYLSPEPRYVAYRPPLLPVTVDTKETHMHVGKVLHDNIDPRCWTARRAEMYFGILLRFKERWCDLIESDSVTQGTLSRFLSNGTAASRTSTSTPSGNKFVNAANDSGELEKEKPAIPKALVYFAVSSHAMSEEISHIQQEMATLAKSKDEKSIKALTYFLFQPFPALFRRMKTIVKGDFQPWEMKFILSHVLLLLCLISLCLFLPLRTIIPASEIAWVYISAVLASQLSAEPTLFVGAIRVFATVTGALLGYGGELVLKAMGRDRNPSIQYITVPYMMVVTVGSLLFFPPSFRYAAFLNILTTSILLFCPFTTGNCNDTFKTRTPDCYTDWRFTITRVTNISLGVVFALVFHFLVWPRFANREVLGLLCDVFLGASRLFAKQHRLYFQSGELGIRPVELSDQQLSKQEVWLRHGHPINCDDKERIYRGLRVTDIHAPRKYRLAELKEEKVDRRLQTAAPLLTSDSAVWACGPLRQSPLLPKIYSDATALSVSLHEMIAILNRKPILSGAYGRSAFDRYIAPCIYEYESLQVALHNLVASMSRAMLEMSKEKLKHLYINLLRDFRHLAEAQEELLKVTSYQRGKLKRKVATASDVKFLDDTVGVDLRVRGSETLRSKGSYGFTIRSPSAIPEIFQLRRSKSFDDNLLISDKREHEPLRPDDAVLFIGFTFSASACLTSFARIARNIILDIGKRLPPAPTRGTKYDQETRSKKHRWPWTRKFLKSTATRYVDRDP